MSLLKQLLVSVSIALLGILMGTLLVSSNAARSYLTEQLHMQSENAVASLALSLSQPANQDPITQELLMSALFDTGQFLRIERTSAEGETLLVLQQKNEHVSAPAWFVALMPLPVAQAQRSLSDGWRQIGEVRIQVDNSVAQLSLWQSTLDTGILVVLAGAAWAVFVTVLLRWFRRVLREEVSAQVRRIGTAESEPSADSQHTTAVAELHELSNAIADTHVRVQHQEQMHVERIETLEVETNRDPVTGLANRKYFVNELNKALQSEGAAQGHLLLVRQRDLHSMNACLPRHEVDAWLQSVGEQLQQLLLDKQLSNAQLARLNGSDFALMISGGNSLEAARMSQAVRHLLRPFSLLLNDGQRSRWAYALTAYETGDIAADVLARLDLGLMQAESAGHDDVEYADLIPKVLERHGAAEGQWQKILLEALEHSEQLMLEVQTLTSASMMETDVRDEAVLQLHDANGQVLSAGLFLPAAVRLGLSAQFDVKAIGLGVEWLAQHPHRTLIVRVSLPSLEQPSFVESVHDLLSSSECATGLVLELDAHALEIAPERVVHLERVMTGIGVGVGLRRLDQAPKALTKLAALQLRFVKVGSNFAEQAIHNVGVQFLLEAMVQTVQTQGARMYVAGMVGSAAADWLRAKGVSLPVPHTE